jgi:hypothetical protein
VNYLQEIAGLILKNNGFSKKQAKSFGASKANPVFDQTFFCCHHSGYLSGDDIDFLAYEPITGCQF